MANYEAPSGYLFDENSGLYYTQVIAQDESGAQSQVVTWFDADSGVYSQNVYPILGDVINEESSSKFKTFLDKLADKARVIFAKGGAGFRTATAGLNETIEANAKENHADEDPAYYCFDEDGSVKEPGIFKKIIYKVKYVINNCPFWLFLAVFGICFAVDVIRSFAGKYTANGTLPCIFIFLLFSVPFGIIHYIDIKKKYGVKVLGYVKSVPTVIAGLFMLAPGVFGNLILVGTFKKIWNSPAPIPVIVYYLFIAAAFAIVYFSLSRSFNKIQLPKSELVFTAIVTSFISFFVGLLAMYLIMLVLIIAFILIFVPILFSAAFSSSGSGGHYSGEVHDVTSYDEDGNVHITHYYYH